MNHHVLLAYNSVSYTFILKTVCSLRHNHTRSAKVFEEQRGELNGQLLEWSLSLITVLTTRDSSGTLVDLLSPCRWAGCTGCQIAKLHRSDSGCRGCATPRCFHPLVCCSSASRPASNTSSRRAPNRRKHAPGPELVTSRPPLRLLRLRQRRESRRSCNWLPLLRPDRRSLLLHRPLQTLYPCSSPTTPTDRIVSPYTAE